MSTATSNTNDRRPSDTSSEEEVREVPVSSEERKTAELVIGLVGPVGSGVTKSAELLRKIIEEEFDYEVTIIKVSDIINENAEKVGHRRVLRNDSRRIEKLQEIGTSLRGKLGEGVLADFCIRKIHESRKGPSEPRRYCTIIDSLKNPGEVERLRSVYIDLFWLLGIFAPENVRIDRLRKMIPGSEYFQKINNQDYDEGKDHGQSVKDTMSLSDMFIRNDRQNTVNLENIIRLFLDRIFDIGVCTPKLEETAMFSAASVATQSACLSRQVGAVIQTSHGDIIGQGANDVPKYNGGSYTTDVGLEGDHRCFNWGGRICHNDEEKKYILGQITSIAKDIFHPQDEKKIQEFSQQISKSRVGGLLEFSRAVHAEMAAIVSVAKEGSGLARGSALFTTTFPCHNCARHIVAAGISKVYYIEPYTKSLALKLHSDSISTNENDSDNKVVFLQYQGAAPRSFSRIFRQNPIRKSDGRMIEKSRRDAKPISASPIDSLFERELLELAKLFEEGSQ
jgi:deoxycytidylate deaminase